MEIKELSDNIYIDDEDTSAGETITQPFSPNDIKLTNPPMNLGDLIDMISYGWIDFKTEYQREEDLWPVDKQSRLIESALLGLRLPAFYFEEVGKKHWKIIDGLQRCCAIRNFCVEKSLVLTDLEFLKFNGCSFDDLSFELRRDIRMLPITVNLLNSGVPVKVKYILFKRLNTGGVELTPQEIRNAVFQGKAIELVKRMACEPSFLVATGGKIPSKRMQDQDFVSRFIAFYLLGYEKYFPDLDNFINTVMEDINNGRYESSVLNQMESRFSMAMLLANTIFGTDAFRKRINVADKHQRINKAYFEVIAVTFAGLDNEKSQKLIANQDVFKANLIKEMRNNKSYNSSFSSGTGQRDSVRRRFMIFTEILNNSIDGKELEYDTEV